MKNVALDQRQTGVRSWRQLDSITRPPILNKPQAKYNVLPHGLILTKTCR